MMGIQFLKPSDPVSAGGAVGSLFCDIIRTCGLNTLLQDGLVVPSGNGL